MNPPPKPDRAHRIILNILNPRTRLDGVLMEALRNQDENPELKGISRARFKALFHEKKILIKGQPARPSSELASGITYVDILI